jgi:hypothetical protein
VTPEVPRQMRLVVETDTRRHLCRGLAVEQTPARGVDPSRYDVSMRRDPEGSRKAPHEMCSGHVEDLPRLGQGDRLEAVLIEEVPEIGRDIVIGALDGFPAPPVEMLLELRAHNGEHRFGLEGLARV